MSYLVLALDALLKSKGINIQVGRIGYFPFSAFAMRQNVFHLRFRTKLAEMVYKAIYHL